MTVLLPTNDRFWVVYFKKYIANWSLWRTGCQRIKTMEATIYEECSSWG